eukprot:366188-Chlamydomonas_euryale.AAC.5
MPSIERSQAVHESWLMKPLASMHIVLGSSVEHWASDPICACFANVELKEWLQSKKWPLIYSNL